MSLDQAKARKYIEERSIPIPFSGCWLWLRSVGSHGYGNACVGNGVEVAHRVSFKAFVGPIPPGMLIQHSCDNKWCVAPYHLSIGTDATNALDKERKGRAAKKLTHRDVIEIRNRIGNGQSMSSVARLYGVDGALVRNIKLRRVWKLTT
jgi:hypothetical protein